MSAVLLRLRAVLDPHRRAIARIATTLLALALGLVLVGGSIRLVRDVGRSPPSATASGDAAVWSVDVGDAVTGLAIDGPRVYVSTGQLSVYPVACRPGDRPCPVQWRGVVPDGPLSVPTIRDGRVYVGSSRGQVYAFEATCQGDGCPPLWVGVAGDGHVSQPSANFDLVYATSDELYAFPATCRAEDLACPPAWTADVPGRPATGPPALGGGLVVVASSSTRGGLAAYPAACADGCRPVWTGRTDGPSTSVAIGGGLAYAVARGSLMAFDLSCTSRCDPVWEAAFLPGRPFATGAAAPPVVAGDSVLVADDSGTMWVFPASCEERRCEPATSIEVAATELLTPVVDGDQVVVTSTQGTVALVDLACATEPPSGSAPSAGSTPSAGPGCRAVVSHRLGARALTAALPSGDAAIGGTAGGAVRSFTW